MPRKNSKVPVAVVSESFKQQAIQDYPDQQWATEGKRKQAGLGKKPADKLTKYESYLLTVHFPAQEKRVEGERAAPKTTPDGEGGVEPGGEGSEADDAEEGGADDENEEETDGAIAVSQHKDVQSARNDNAENSENEDQNEDQNEDDQSEDAAVKVIEPAKNARVAGLKRTAQETSASPRVIASKKPRREVQAPEQAPEQEASADEDVGVRRRQKSSDSQLYRTYVAGKVLPAELRSWFLISILARDGVDTQGRAPHS